MCGTEAGDNHWFTNSRQIALQRDLFACVRCGSTKQLEVNHKIPCMGTHNLGGCQHHADKLEVLCRTHHLQITAIQRQQGLFGR